MVAQGAVGVVAAQAGGDAGRHGDRAHGAPLSLQKEGPLVAAGPDDAEGVGPHRLEDPIVAEEAGRPPGRVEPSVPPVPGAGLRRQRRQEAVRRLGVLQVAQELAAAGARDVAPGQGVWRSTAGGLRPRRPGPGGTPSPTRGRKGQAAVTLGNETAARSSRRSESRVWYSRVCQTPNKPARHSAVNHGQSKSRSRARFSVGLSSMGSIQPGSPARPLPGQRWRAA